MRHCSFLFLFARLYFFLVKANFPRHKEAIALYYLFASMVHFLFISIRFFFNLSDFFFKRGNSLFYSVAIVYFRQTQLIILAYFGKINKFFKKNTVFSLFSSLFFCPIREDFVYFISETANGLRLYKTLTIIYKTKAFSQKKRNEYN